MAAISQPDTSILFVGRNVQIICSSRRNPNLVCRWVLFDEAAICSREGVSEALDLFNVLYLPPYFLSISQRIIYFFLLLSVYLACITNRGKTPIHVMFHWSSVYYSQERPSPT